MAGDAKFQIGIKALIVNDKNEILLLKSDPNKAKFSDVEFWDLPGGRIKEGDNIEQTLKREMNEELGISEENVSIEGVFDATISKFKASKTDSTSLMLIVYKCSLNKNDSFKLSDEHDDFGWFPPEEAKGMLKIKFPEDFTEKLNKIKA